MKLTLIRARLREREIREFEIGKDRELLQLINELVHGYTHS